MNRRTFNVSMLGLLTLPAALEASCTALQPGTDEKHLVVMPILNSQEVLIVPPARPHCFVRHLSLEGFSCRNWQVIPNASQGTWGTNHTWEWKEDGTFGCIGRVAERVRYTLHMSPGTDVLDIRVTVRNLGTRTLEGLFGSMCVDVRRNTLMYDAALARSYVSVDGRAIPMNTTDVVPSRRGVMPIYFLKGTAPERRWIPEAWPPYGWGVSTTEIDLPLTAVVSTDGGWIVGVWFWPCQLVSGNAKLPWHGCIHSNPAFGTLAPGGSATAVGRLYIARGRLQEIWARMAADWGRSRETAPDAAG